MSSKVLYGQDVFRPYFSMSRFENVIYNKYAEREKRIKTRRRLRMLDRLIVVIAIISFCTLLYLLSAILIQNMKLARSYNEVAKLEETLEKRQEENSSKTRLIKSEIKFEELKMKAYMELNMITPTEKNIIYFDKSDNGFVRQYENIR